MPDIPDGESVEMKGSAATPYILKNVGGVYSCSCPAWRNQSIAIEKRTCKHLRKYRGEQAEIDRVGSAAPPKREASGDEEGDEAKGPPLLLAQTWTNDVDLAGWWMSEKLDGLRAYWDGKQLLSRLGNVLHAPNWFVAELPATPLDGELWLARKSFQRTSSIVRRQDKSDHWKEISYLIFDAPAEESPFEERMKFLKDALARNTAKHIQLHEHLQCKSVEHLREELARVEALGGEGLMLREPGSKYQIGRSSTLLKVKTFHDAEARVVEHQGGSGRHKGRLGALVVQLADGTQFSVGTGFSDAQRGSPPPIGSTITFRYQELSDRGVPRFPSFVRLNEAAKIEAAKPEAANIAQPSAATAAPPAAAKIKKSKGQSPPTPTQQSEKSMAKRYFEYEDDKSSKFWEIDVKGKEVTVRFGRIGANGQTQTKTFDDNDAAQKHADKLIEEKTDKGYVES
ncbi:MAG: DNA ligase [Planctomycetaceae bacterium]|nr:DNA ligase [Planctomycetaceae bacterium]